MTKSNLNDASKKTHGFILGIQTGGKIKYFHEGQKPVSSRCLSFSKPVLRPLSSLSLVGPLNEHP